MTDPKPTISQLKEQARQLAEQIAELNATAGCGGGGLEIADATKRICQNKEIFLNSAKSVNFTPKNDLK